jgi:hypothetical protein
MDDELNQKFFLLIGLKKISFAALKSKDQFFFHKEILLDNLSIEENLKSLENFLEKNIFEIEKNLNLHVKEIFLIIDYDIFLKVDLSPIYNFKSFFNKSYEISNSLIDISNNFRKSSENYEIIHTIINKFIIDGKTYFKMPMNEVCENIYLEVSFICLQKVIINSFRKILTKYQISLKKILSYEYISHFKDVEERNIYVLADRVVNGLNENEIFIVHKVSKNRGFFEKFFNFFS